MLFLQDIPDNVSPAAESADAPLHRVLMDEALRFLAYRKKAALLIPLGVVLCILSPVALILLAVAQESGMLQITEQQAAGLGLLILFVLVGVAVALFIVSGLASKAFEHLDHEPFEADDGVRDYVREQKDKANGAFTAQLVCGIVLCVISVIPIFLAMLFAKEDASDFVYAVAVSILLGLVALGVWLIVHAAILRGGCSILLEEGDYTRSKKLEQKRAQPIATIYWCLVVAGYLAYSFITSDWQRSWIVWPVAGVLFGLVMAVVSSVQGKDK